LNLTLAGTGGRNRGKIKTTFKTRAGSTAIEQLSHHHKLIGLNLAQVHCNGTGRRNREKIKTTFKTSAGSTVVEQLSHNCQFIGLNPALAGMGGRNRG